MKITKHYIDEQGNSLGSFEGALPPKGSIEVPSAPNHGLDVWDGEKWNANAQLVIERVYNQAKDAKILAVSQITVTTASGKAFDGDEVSQNRMARAVTASNAGDTTQWKLADNTQATVTHEELKEALLLAGNAMTVIWMA